MRTCARLLVILLLAGCGAASPHTTTPREREVIDMEEMRITARRAEDGSLALESYDAETLFHRATDLLNRRRCTEAVVLYDRLAAEFAGSRYRSPALYNAGLCLQDIGQKEEAAVHYERLLSEEPESSDVRHATLQLAQLTFELERWDRTVELADTLLARDDLSPDERMEAMARRSQGLLGQASLDEAARQARTAVQWYQTRPEEQRVRDEFFAAASNFVLAETLRKRADAIPIPQASVEIQRDTLERRARLMLDAQREYFNTMHLRNPHWAAAAGYRIGAMYDKFYDDIVGAPLPPPRNPLNAEGMQIYEEEYRRELARIVEPLMRHAIRYWELTLMMVERTGVVTEWSERVRDDLERARVRLVDSARQATPGAPALTGETATGLGQP